MDLLDFQLTPFKVVKGGVKGCVQMQLFVHGLSGLASHKLDYRRISIVGSSYAKMFCQLGISEVIGVLGGELPTNRFCG